MSKAKDLREQSPDDLEQLLIEKRHELFDTYNRNHTEKSNKQPAQTRQIRKTIARILTIQREREIEQLAGGQ